MIITNILLYLASFVAIWMGAGFVIGAVDKIARRLKLSSFVISFFLLGLLTSIPETAVSFNAVAEHTPEIFVGTLLGGVVVIFLFVIPILAILGKGIKVNHSLSQKHLGLVLGVTALPSLLVLDQKISNFEGLLMLLAYGVLFYIIQRKHGLFDHNQTHVLEIKAYSFLDLLKVALGIGVVFISSNYIVEQTVNFSNLFGIPAFYISLIVLSLGTNLPELSLAIRGITSGKQEIAFGDYLGSAAANTLLFGFFTLLNDGEVLTVSNFLTTFILIILGLGTFFYFSNTQRIISRREGFVLLSFYLVFVLYELGKEVIF